LQQKYIRTEADELEPARNVLARESLVGRGGA
jgi:hypothetical protein